MQYDMTQLLRLAKSADGQQLLALLQKNGGAQLQAALSQASGGNYEDAKALLSSLLSSAEAQGLLKRLEELS